MIFLQKHSFRYIFILAFVFSILSCQNEMQTQTLDDTAMTELYYMSKTDESDTTSLSALKSECRKDKKTEEYTLKAWQLTRVLFSATLGRLGYGTGPFTWKYGKNEEKALRKFQMDLNIPVTGRLDSITINNLTLAMASDNQNKVVLPQFTFYSWTEGLFATGTWKAIENKLGYRFNAVDIYCNRQMKTCDIVKVDFISKELNQISIHRSFYDIVYWTDEMIIAKSNPPIKTDCKETITINIPAKEIVMKQVCPEQEFLGKLVPSEQMTLKLVDGFGAFNKGKDEFKDVRDEVYKYKTLYFSLYKKNFIDIDTGK